MQLCLENHGEKSQSKDNKPAQGYHPPPHTHFFTWVKNPAFFKLLMMVFYGGDRPPD